MADTPKTIWNRNFILLFIVNCIVNFGHSMVANLLPKYLDSIGLAGTAIGFIISLFSFTALGFRTVTGPLIDGWDKKKLYMMMLAVLILSFAGYTFFPIMSVIVAAIGWKIKKSISFNKNVCERRQTLPQNLLLYNMIY